MKQISYVLILIFISIFTVEPVFGRTNFAPHAVRLCSLVVGNRNSLLPICVSGEVTNTSQRVHKHNLTDYATVQGTLPKKQVVKIEYIINNNPITDNTVLNKLQQKTFIKVGSHLSRYDIQRSIKALYSLQQFSQINVYTVQSIDGVIVKYDLTNFMLMQKIDISGVESDALTIAIRSVIRLEPGDLYVPESAESNIATIKAVCADYGYFNTNVNIKTFATEAIDNNAAQSVRLCRVVYSITLGNPSVIKHIEITGNTAIFTERIKEACKTDIGKVYRKSLIDEDRKAIRELYRKKYYPTTAIVTDFKYQTGVLVVKIEEGTQLLLDFVDDNGQQIIQESAIRAFMSNLGIIRYKSEKEQLRDKITSLISNRNQVAHSVRLGNIAKIVQSHFEAKGYDGTQVQVRTLTQSPLHVQVTVTKGVRYVVTDVTFSGNRAFTQRELLREMDTKPVHPVSKLIRKRIFSQPTLARDIQRLIVLYTNGGYPNVVIQKPELNKRRLNNKGSGKASIHITINENYKEVINRVKFIGNTALESNTILNSLPNRPPEPNASLIRKKYENAVQKTYQDQGYLDVQVRNTKYIHKMDTPTFQVPGLFSDQLDSGAVPQALQKAFRENGHSLAGTYVVPQIVEEWSIQDEHDNPRYTLVQEREQLSVYEHGVLQFEIDEGAQVVFGNFYFVGDTGVKRNILEREVAHLPGTLYIPEKLNQVVQNLNGTGIFEPGIHVGQVERPRTPTHSVRLYSEDIETHPIVKDVLIRLHKQKPRYTGASIGYISSDGLRGTIAFSHLNLFKRNVRFRLRGRGGTRSYLFDTTLTQPWLIDRTSASLNFLGRKLEQDDNVRALQGSFSLSRKLSRFHRLNLEYSYRDLLDTYESALITNPSTTVSSLRFLWRQDSRFPVLNPTTGILNEWTVEYAGGYLGGKSSFVKAITDTRYYHSLNNRGFVLATALRLGVTTGLLDNSTGPANNGEELISFERFYAGGSTTIRGYEERGLGPEDSTGKHRGNVQFIFNTELRFPIITPIYGVLFYDTGNVWGTIDDITYGWMPASVGVGLRLNFGPIIGGIDYAVPLISVPDVPQDSFYFRFGTAF